MKHLIFAFLAIFTLFFGIQNSYSQTLSYGDEIHLQNSWNNYSGGFLDTRGYDRDYEKTGNHPCVSTATTNARATGTGTWKVLSAKGKDIGDPVLIGDEIHLQNGWDNYTGGFLDARGYQKDFAKTGNHLSVSTATVKNRDIGSGTWKIISATGKDNGTPVTQNFEVHLQNGWNNYSGGFLDTRGYQRDYAKTENHLCVSTANEKNRQNSGSGVWKVQIAGKSSSNSGESLPDEFAGWFRLKNVFRGDGECLEGNQINGTAKGGSTFMDKCQNVSGQLWKLEPAGDGFYRLKNQFRGDGECLEGNKVNSTYKGGGAFMNNCSNEIGQLWKLEPDGNGNYRLKNKFRGDGECLEGNQINGTAKAGSAFMDKCQNVTGQFWKIEKVQSGDER